MAILTSYHVDSHCVDNSHVYSCPCWFIHVLLQDISAVMPISPLFWLAHVLNQAFIANRTSLLFVLIHINADSWFQFIMAIYLHWPVFASVYSTLLWPSLIWQLINLSFLVHIHALNFSFISDSCYDMSIVSILQQL